VSRDDIPNLVPAKCCGECSHANDHEDTRYAYCRKHQDLVYITEKCDDYEDVNDPR